MIFNKNNKDNVRMEAKKETKTNGMYFFTRHAIFEKTIGFDIRNHDW